jgi:ribonuclease III
MTARSLQQLEKRIGHSFKDKDLLTHALTHSSTAGGISYERLEFLGDRVLGLGVAEMLYKRFPGEKEGDLASRLNALVQAETLARMATDLGLGAYIIFSESERVAGGAEKLNILADVFEALIGALYLDAGLNECRELIESLWADNFYDMKAPPQHPKTILQEWAQGQGLPLPEYEISSQAGPDHAPVFDVKLNVKGYPAVIGKGASRQAAEKEAARAFLEKLFSRGST